jgi:tRNA (adenine57-N1/adenine58-N1)-methyltransferase
MRLLIKDSGEIYQIDPSKDFHTKWGQIKKDQLNQPDGTIVTAANGDELTLSTPTFLDKYQKIKRGAAIIIAKDAGMILATTMVGPESICVDAGSGSGALTIFLARYTKHVYSYDNRQEHLDVVQKNLDTLEIKNVTLQLNDVHTDIPAKDVDLITLDLPNTELALPNVLKSLKVGGWLVLYIPNVTQVQTAVVALNATKSFLEPQIMEIIARTWTVDEKRARPAHDGLLSHTAFLVFARRHK